MKIDTKTLIMATIIIIFAIGFKITESLTEVDIDYFLIIVLVAVTIFCRLLIIARKDFVQNLNKEKKTTVIEALELLNFNKFFPQEVAKTIDSYFSKESSNVALAVFKINEEPIEYYWAVSNTKVDKKFDEKKYLTISKSNISNGKPILFCKDKHSNIDFFVRGSEGELIPLNSKDINYINKINSFSTSYYTCSERKLIGEFLSRNQSKLNSSSEDEYKLIIFSKRPPCKYCNDLIEYYRNLYKSRLSLFVFDNLLLNLVNNDNDSHISFDNLDDAVKAVREFEKKREMSNNQKNEQNNKLQNLNNQIKKHDETIKNYKHIIEVLIKKIKESKGTEPNRDDIKKISCINDRRKEGFTDKEFDEIWSEDI